MLRKYLFVLLVCFIGAGKLFAQEDLYPTVSNLTDVPVGNYRSVFQGENSLWLGVDEGLVRINGKYVERFYSNNSPISSRVNDIIQDANGNVWASTNTNGVILYEVSARKFFQFTHQNGLNSERCDFFTLSGRQVFVTCNNGLYSINIDSHVVENHLSGTPLFQEYNTAFNTIATDKSGKIWLVADDDALYRYDPVTKALKMINTNGVRFQHKTLLLWDSKDRLWIANENNIYNLKTAIDGYRFRKLRQTIKYHRLYSIIEDSYGNIWGGTDFLLKYDESEEQLVYADALRPLFQDGRRIQYILDFTEGALGELYFVGGSQLTSLPVSKDALSYFTVDKDISSFKMYDILPVSNTKSLIQFNRALYVYDKDSKKSDIFYESKLDMAFLRALNSKSSLIFEDEKWLRVIDNNTGESRSFDTHKLGLPSDIESLKVLTALVDDEGFIYLSVLGESQGIFAGTLEDGFVNILSDVRSDTSLKGRNGSLFFSAFERGVYEYTKDKKWLLWPTPEGVRLTYVYCLIEDHNGKIWLCDGNNGLAYLDTKSQSIVYLNDRDLSSSKGIIDATIGAEGNIWMVTSNDAIRFSPKTNSSISLSEEAGDVGSFGGEDSVYNLTHNEVLFRGDKYSYIVNTKLMNKILNERQEATYKSIIESIKVLSTGNTIGEGKSSQQREVGNFEGSLIASNNDFLFTFHFAVNNFIEREDFKFEYRLLGLNDDWLLAERDTATFSKLPSGNYTLEVRVIDARSNIEQPITRMPIKVLPPYWLTKQAYVVYVALTLFLFYGLYRYRTGQLKQANIQLEKSVAVRTRELTERSDELSKRTSELSESNQQISNLLAQKESLFANVSHEFRTPLTLILGPMSELRSKQSDKSDVHKFDMMHRNTKRLVQLVEQILELARLDTAVEAPKQMYAIDALSVLVNSFKPLAELKGQELVFSNNCSGGLSLTKDALEKILYNLLSNAIKYSPEGGTITVIGEQIDNLYQLSVQDTGVGIPEEELENIFERFTRLEKTAEQLGSGLGLAVVKELVKTNNGTIEVISELNAGTTFLVTLPLLSNFDANQASSLSEVLLTLDSASEIMMRTESTAPVVTLQRSEVIIDRKPVLLIIEDNVDMQTYIRQSLASDYECITANNGQQGIDIANETIPDIILSDLMMPLKGGFEVVDALRSDELTAHIPITLLTAKGDDASRLTGWQKRVDDYISKPFNVEELKLRLSRLLSIRDIVKKRVTQQLSHKITLGNNAISNAEELEETKEKEVMLNFSNKRDEQFYVKVMKVIEDNYTDSDFGRGHAADKLAVSERQLNRKLSAIVEYNFAELVRKYRLRKAKALLLLGHQIGEVAYDVGFTSPSYFSRCFKAEFDCSPKEFLLSC